MDNEDIYSVGKEFGKATQLFAKQNVSWVLRGLALLVKHSWTWQLGMTLQLLVMCSICGLFAGFFTWATCELVANSTDSPFEAWFFTNLSHLSLTNKPTYIQGKWLKKLQSNLAQHKSQHKIVGNHNFTLSTKKSQKEHNFFLNSNKHTKVITST